MALLCFVAAGCGNNDASLSEADIQATVNAAVAATTEALAPPTFTPIPTITTEGDEASVAETSEESGQVAEPTATPVPPPTETPEPTETPLPELPLVITDLGDGNTRYDMPFDQFAVLLPNDWVVVDIQQVTDSPDQAKVEELLGSGIFRNLVESGVKFYAINWSDASLAAINPANINISTQPAGGVSSIEEFGVDFFNLLTYQFQIEPEAISQTTAALSGYPAVRFDYAWNHVNPVGTAVDLQIVQHVVLVGETIYVSTISIPSELSETLLPAAENAVQQIEFYP